MTLSCGHNYENGSGRRKRYPGCAEKYHREQLRGGSKKNHAENYVKKRPPK